VNHGGFALFFDFFSFFFPFLLEKSVFNV